MIYLDMDGVLADFDGWIAKLGHQNECSFIHRPREEWTPSQIALDKIVVDAMATPGFFRNLEPMPGCHELWNYCKEYDPVVLTARPKDPLSAERVTREKRDWITEQFGPIPDNRFICCLRSEKQDFIGHTQHPHQILVDDLEQNCKDWVAVGGIAIIHTSAESSIKQLEQILGRN